jgi:hypothetical protein
MTNVGETSKSKWVSIPGVDHTDVDKLITVETVRFELGAGVPESIRRVKLLASEGTSLEISFSMKSILPLCQALLDIVQADINQGGELVRGECRG